MAPAPRTGGGFAPGRHLLDSYGRGGFRFGGLSHVGSLLILPSGTAAWRPVAAAEITAADLAPALREEPRLDFFLIGTGPDIAPLPERLRAAFRERGVSVDAMSTGAAARTYNVLLAEERRVGAALIAVE